MASPQIENGYLKIANEIIDFLIHYKLRGEEWLILLTVWRKTYGYNKTDDKISLSQFAELTHLKRANVVRAIKGLVSKGILASIKSDTSEPTSYSFIKDYEKWKVVSEVIPSIRSDTRGGIKSAKKVVSEVIPTKDNTKYSIKYREKKFIPPKLDQVKSFIKERGSPVDPDVFFNNYESTGWIKANGQPVKNWKSTIITWELREKKKNESVSTRGKGYSKEEAERLGLH